MLNGYETFIARRYLLRRKKTGFISVISIISILGIALGVAALIIVLSLMNGFTGELRSRLVGMDGHIWVSTPIGGGMSDYEETVAKLSAIRGVTGVSPFCSFMTVAHDRSRKRFQAMEVRGIQHETVDNVTEIREYITEGRFDLTRNEKGIPGVVLGRVAARALGASVGDRIFVLGGDSVESIVGAMTPPPIREFIVNGLFESGYYEYDAHVALIGIAEAQRMLDLQGKVSGIAIKINNAFDADRYTRNNGFIDQALGGYPYFSENWIEKNQILFNWMKLEKWAAFIVLSLIILVAAFNIITTLIMMVMDKTREVGILKSMGATNKSIKRIFVYQGAFVGVIGTLIGSITGYTLCFIQDKYRVLSLPSDIYFVSAVPMDLQIRDLIIITVVSLFLCWASSYYPARKAASLDPVEAIRSE